MPFLLGRAPFRRTLKYLESGSLVFKDRVKVMTLNYNVNEHDDLVAAVHPEMAPAVKERPWMVRAGKTAL